MGRLKRGFQFLNQAGRIARNSPSVIKPLGIFLAAGTAAALVFSAAIGLLAARLGMVGVGLAGFLAGCLAAALLLAGYLASVEVARRVYHALSSSAQPDEGPAWSLLAHWLDLVGVAVASLLIGPLHRVGLARHGTLAAPWSRAVELVSTSMAVEKLELRQGLERANQMVTENLLFISPGQIAAVWAGAITGLPFWVGGGLLGWAIWRGIELSSWISPLKAPLALAVGILAACVVILIGIAESAFSSAAYRACLFAWARSVESGRSSGDPHALEPPQPLSACLAGLESLTAPVYLNSNETQV